MGWVLSDYNRANSITIHVDIEETELVNFQHIGLIPGESCEYKIKFKGREDVVLNLDFIEKEEKGLKNFAYVRIVSEDKIIFEELLADAFESEEIVLPVSFYKDLNTELTIIYYLPAEVGNEAKNAEADFDLEIRASEIKE